MGEDCCLLGNEKHVDRAEVELVEEGKGCQPIVCGMLASVQLEKNVRTWKFRIGGRTLAYHDSLPLVLYNMARPADLVAAAQSQEHELVRGINGFVADGGAHGRCLAL